MSTYEEMHEHGCTIRIENDNDPENPFKEWDMMGHLLTFHRRYSFSNDKPQDWGIIQPGDDTYVLGGTVCLTSQDIFDHLEQAYDAVVLPVYLFDHSGLSVRTSDAAFRAADSMGWDWGFLGVIFITREEILQKYVAYTRKGKERPRYENGKTIYPEWLKRAHVTKKDRAAMVEALTSEIATLDQYLTGDVWGYVVTHEASGSEDSLWGMYGYDYCVDEAKAAAKSLDDTYAADCESVLDDYVASLAAD